MTDNDDGALTLSGQRSLQTWFGTHDAMFSSSFLHTTTANKQSATADQHDWLSESLLTS